MTDTTLTTIDLEIGGMTCSSCANRIERKLSKLPGVEASVNYATEVAHVTLPEGMTVADAIRTVEQTGYTAAVPEPEAEGDHDANGTSLRTRLVASAVLGLPVGVLSMAPALQIAGWQWVALALTLPIAIWGAWPFHRAAAVNLRHGAATMDTLVSLGVIAAMGWSLWALIWGTAGEIGMRMQMQWFGGHGDELYLEVAAIVTVFLLGGRYIEHRTKRSSQQAMRSLARLGAKEASVIRDGVQSRIAVSDLVVGATINGHGMLVVEATRVGADTELSRIASLLQRAQEGKADVQRLVGVLAVGGHDALHAHPPLGDGAGLVDEHRGDAAARLEHARVADQDAQLGAARRAGQQRGRGREAQRARAGDDERRHGGREGGGDVAGEDEPAHEREQREHERGQERTARAELDREVFSRDQPRRGEQRRLHRSSVLVTRSRYSCA